MVKGELKSLRITLEATETGVLGYVYFQEVGPGEVAKSVEIDPKGISADYDAEQHLLGVEFLHAEEANAEVMHRLAKELDTPELAGINLAEMCKAPAQE